MPLTSLPLAGGMKFGSGANLGRTGMPPSRVGGIGSINQAKGGALTSASNLGKKMNSISQNQGIAHVYQVGDRTGVQGAGGYAGQGSNVSIAQAIKNKSLTPPGTTTTGGVKPILPLK